MPKKTKENVEKTYTDPVTGKFVKGNPGGGRPKGSESFATKWKQAIEKLAETNDISGDELELQILQMGIKKAREGDYSFYRDTFDRVYGKPQQSIDHTSAGERIGLEVDDELMSKMVSLYASNTTRKDSSSEEDI